MEERGQALLPDLELTSIERSEFEFESLSTVGPGSRVWESRGQERGLAPRSGWNKNGHE